MEPASLRITDSTTLESAVTAKVTAAEGENNNNQDKASLSTNVAIEETDVASGGLELSAITSTRKTTT